MMLVDCVEIFPGTGRRLDVRDAMATLTRIFSLGQLIGMKHALPVLANSGTWT